MTHSSISVEEVRAVERYASGRERVEDIVDDTGINRGRLYRVANKLGVVSRNRQRVLASLSDHIDGLKLVEAVDFLFGIVDDLLVDEESESFRGFRTLGFEPASSRILCELDRCRGDRVGFLVLEVLSNPMRDSNANGSNVLKVHVSKIRKKLREIGCPVEIRTVWGSGYIMHVPDGYRWPWEGGK